MMPQRTAQPHARHSRSLRPLLSSCAMTLALAAALQGGSARAQVAGLQGTPTVDAGSAVISATGTALAPRTDVTVSSTTAVINWTPTDTDTTSPTPVDFLPSGSTAAFSGSADFTVLNRILPVAGSNRAIGLNGTVTGQVGSGPGGNIWFYSPTGITAGGTASFSAHGIMLTANDIPYAPGPSGGITFGPLNSIQMTTVDGSQAAVVMQPGSSISGQGANAYAVLVAPKVVQSGTIRLDGSVALVAAEQVDMRIGMGLFDIDLVKGTSVTDAVTVTGVTGGDQGTAVTGPQKVYVAAMPKNTAINMLVGGQLGTTTASTADGAVILSGGYDIADVTGFGLSSVPDFGTDQQVNVSIGTAAFNENLTAIATGSITGSPDAGGDAIDFVHDASLTGREPVTLQAELGESILAGGNLELTSPQAVEVHLTTTPAGSSTPATVTVAGDLHLNASNEFPDGFSISRGGTATIRLDAGAVAPVLTVEGLTTVEADGEGAEGPIDGSQGQGGTAQILVNGGTFEAADIDLHANGFGFFASSGGNGLGGIGGTATLATNGGSLSFASMDIGASGSGAGARLPGQGGTVTINASGGTLSGDTISADVSGTGGIAPLTDDPSNLFTGGTGQGGSFVLNLNGGAIDVNSLSVDATGSGGAAESLDSNGLSGIPGQGTGGAVTVNATSGSFTSTDLVLDASGFGGDAGDGGSVGSPQGGSGQGGTIAVALGGASFKAENSTLHADGIGADGATNGGTSGGSGTGGTATITATDAAGYSLGDLTITADGMAGDSAGAFSDGVGTGGTAKFINQGAAATTPDSRTVDSLTLSADGVGGANGQTSFASTSDQNSVGGFVQVSDLASGANGRLAVGQISASAAGFSAAAGSGALLESAGGPMNLDGSIDIDAAGTVTVAVTGDSTISTGLQFNLSSSAGDVVITHGNQTTPLIPTMRGSLISVDAANNISAGAGTLLSGTSFLMLRARNGDITADSLTSGDDLHVNAFRNVSLNNATSTGPVFTQPDGTLIGGLIDITAGVETLDFVGPYQPFDVTVGGAVSASGQLQVHAGRDIVGNAGSLLQGQAVQLIAERSIAGAGPSMVSRGDLDIFVSDSLAAGNIDVAGNVNMIDLNGVVTQAGRIVVPGALAIGGLTLRNGSLGLLRAGGDLSVGAVQATGLDVATPGGTLTVGSLTDLSGAPSSFLTAVAPSVALGAISVSGDIDATATTGTLSASGLDAGGSVTLTSNASTVTVGGARAQQDLTISAPGAVTIGGQASGANILVFSNDITIDPAGRLGTPGQTATIDLINSDPTRRSFYGGADNAAGYSLSGAEAGRLFADDITLLAPQTPQSGPASPDVVVGTMNLTSRANDPGGQLGSQGFFAILTGGSVRIDGAVTLTGAGSGNTFSISAGDLIMLDNQRGLIDLQGPGGTLGGTIDLSARQIMAVSTAAQQALSGLSDPVDIDLLLATNDGTVNERGVLRADALHFNVTDALYIQNTGGGTFFSPRAGFTAGRGGVSITAFSGSSSGISVAAVSGSPTPLVVINGQATTSAGGKVVGLAAIPLVRINGQPAPTSSGYAVGSTINGCVFSNVAACTPDIPALPPQSTPTRDQLETPVETTAETAIDQTPTVDTTEIAEIGSFSYEPLIDEPITGSGNDDLWTPTCDPGKQGSCPSAAEPPADKSP